MVRAVRRDAARSFPIAGVAAPIREAGLEMARAGLELVPIVDDDGALAGVMTERALARRYIRETRETSTLQDAPTRVSAIVEVLDGKLLAGEDRALSGRVWVQAMDPTRTRDLRRRRRRGRQPRRRPADGDREGRAAARAVQRLDARRTRSSSSPASAAPR